MAIKLMHVDMGAASGTWCGRVRDENWMRSVWACKTFCGGLEHGGGDLGSSQEVGREVEPWGGRFGVGSCLGDFDWGPLSNGGWFGGGIAG